MQTLKRAGAKTRPQTGALEKIYIYFFLIRIFFVQTLCQFAASVLVRAGSEVLCYHTVLHSFEISGFCNGTGRDRTG